jgi:hypothetical protein
VTGLPLVNRQIALKNAQKLTDGAIRIYSGARCFLPGLTGMPSNALYVLQTTAPPKGKAPLPALTLKVTDLLENLKEVYKAFTNAQFVECKEFLQLIFRSIPLTSVGTRTETVSNFVDVWCGAVSSPFYFTSFRFYSTHHIITRTLHHTKTPSHHHTITPSHHHTITPSHHHTITPSPQHNISQNDLKELLDVSREYMIAIRIKVNITTLPSLCFAIAL